MTTPNFVEIDGILLPSFLFSFSERKSKSISPAALINPDNVNGGNVFQSLISPSDIPSKKTIIIDGQIDVSFDRAKQIGFLKKLKLLGFDIYLCCASNRNENQFFEFDDELRNIDKLNNLSNFSKINDYEKLAELNISHEKSVFLDYKKLENIKNSLNQNCYSGQIFGNSWEGNFYAVKDEEVLDVIKSFDDDDIYNQNSKILTLAEKQIKKTFEEKEDFGFQDLKKVTDIGIISKELAAELVKNHSKRIKDSGDLEFCFKTLLDMDASNEAEKILEEHKDKVYWYSVDSLLRLTKLTPNNDLKSTIMNKFENIVEKHKDSFLSENLDMADYFFDKYGRDSFRIKRLLQALPNETENILEKYKNKIRYPKDLLTALKVASPQTMEFLLEKHGKLINGDELSSFLREVPQIAEPLLNKSKYNIRDCYDLACFLKAAPNLAEHLLEQHENKIQRDDDLVECLQAAPDFAEHLLEKHGDKIKNISTLVSFLQAAPDFAKHLLEKHGDKIENSYYLAACIKAVPDFAEHLLEKHGDKIQNAFNLVCCLEAVPDFAEHLLEKYGDKINNSYDLATCIKAVPDFAEHLLEKHVDKIQDDYGLVRCLKAVPDFTEYLLEKHGDKVNQKASLISFIKYAPHIKDEIFEQYKKNLAKNSPEIEFLPESLDEIILSLSNNSKNYNNFSRLRGSNDATFLKIAELDQHALTALKERINQGELENISAARVDDFEENILSDFLQILPESVKHLTLPKKLQDEIIRLPNDLSSKFQIKLVHASKDINDSLTEKNNSTVNHKSASNDSLTTKSNFSTNDRVIPADQITSKNKSNDILIDQGFATHGLSIKKSGKENDDSKNSGVSSAKIKAGEVLNLSSSDEIRLRTSIIDRNIKESFETTERKPNQLSLLENIQPLSEQEIKSFKNKSDAVYCKFEQELEANQTFRLLSINTEEEIVGVKVYNHNKQSISDKDYQIHKGDDGFFYATSNENCIIEYVLKSEFPNLESYKTDIPTDHPIKKIIDDYKDVNQGYKDADDGRKVSEYTPSKHQDFLKEIYDNRSGVCEHRVAAVEYKIAQNEEINKDDYRVVMIDNNHVRLEVRYKDKWHMIDCGGAYSRDEATRQSENKEGEIKKYKSATLGFKPFNVNFDEEKKKEEESLNDKKSSNQEEQKNANFDEEKKKEEEQKEKSLIKEKKEESPTLKILRSCLEKNIIPTTINSKEHLIAEVLDSKTNDSNITKTLILTKEIEPHANFILENARKNGRECYYIDNPDKIDFNRLNLFISDEEENRAIFKNEGLLQDFLNIKIADDNGQKPLLLINWQSFTPHQRLALNTLLDKKGRIHGEEVNCDIVGFCEEKTDDSSFLTRHNLLLTSNLKLANYKTNSQSKNSEPIDLQGFDNWKQTLFGRVEVNNDKMLWQKSDFVQKLENGIKDFEIFNIDEKAAANLQYEFRQAQALGYFSYHGNRIELPEGFNIKIAKESFNFKKFNAADIFVKDRTTFDNTPADCRLINSNLFDEVLRKKKISDDFYQETDGLIEECAKTNPNKVLKLFISSDLSDGQWYSLFNQAQKNDVKLNLYLAPKVEIPNQVNRSKIDEQQDQETSISLEDVSLERKLPQIFITNDISGHTKAVVANLVKEDQGNIEEKSSEDEKIHKWQENLKKAKVAAIIDVEDMSYQDLVEMISFEISEDGFKNFEKKESEVLTALKNGQKVILRGTFAEELLQMMEPIFVSHDPELQSLKDNLILIIEDNCKNNSYYEPLKWLSNSDYQISNYEKNSSISNRIEFLENPDLSNDLDNSQEESQKFIKQRKDNFLQLLENNQMLRLVGHSGVGKSGLIKEFKENNEDTVEIYRELSSFEDWANDKSDKKKILFIDESNIEDTHFTIFSPLKKDGNKRLLHHGKFYDLDENHKVVFACNPKEYGGGRVSQKLFDDSEIPVMYLRDFTASYIYEELLKKPIFDGINPLFKEGNKPIFSEKKFKEVCQNLIAEYKQINSESNLDEANQETVRELQEKTLLALDDIFAQNKYREIRSENFVSTEATFNTENALRRFISIRENQKYEIFGNNLVGLNGFLLEGESGVGKSEMIEAILKDKKIDEKKLEDEFSSSKLSYYKIDANMSLDVKKQIIAKAYEEGNIVRIDELNSCIDDGFEKILNLALTGDHPLGENKTPQTGFMVISSINSVASKGRSPISPAMLHRFNVVKAKNLKEYSKYDMNRILDNIAGYSEDEIGNYVTQKEYGGIIEQVANDFCEIKRNDKSFNIRSLASNFSEIYEKYSEVNASENETYQKNSNKNNEVSSSPKITTVENLQKNNLKERL